jgi:hypothetical protein
MGRVVRRLILRGVIRGVIRGVWDEGRSGEVESVKLVRMRQGGVKIWNNTLVWS